MSLEEDEYSDRNLKRPFLEANLEVIDETLYYQNRVVIKTSFMRLLLKMRRKRKLEAVVRLVVSEMKDNNGLE